MCPKCFCPKMIFFCQLFITLFHPSFIFLFTCLYGSSNLPLLLLLLLCLSVDSFSADCLLFVLLDCLIAVSVSERLLLKSVSWEERPVNVKELPGLMPFVVGNRKVKRRGWKGPTSRTLRPQLRGVCVSSLLSPSYISAFLFSLLHEYQPRCFSLWFKAGCTFLSEVL